MRYGFAQSFSFVGRQREIAALRAPLAAACAGHGGVVSISGDAGIGKTRLAREFAARAQTEGNRLLWGTCYEGDGSPPYAPWVQALDEYPWGLSPERLQQQLGQGIETLARLVPAIAAAHPGSPAPAPLSPEEERFRLHEAMAQLLFSLAARQPVVLVLDDVQWADQASLGLLRHVARITGQTRLLIIVIYRPEDLDLDPRHPLAGLLVALHRECPYYDLPLEGLSQAEVALLLRQATPEGVPDQLTRAVHADTAGNPFFVEEIIRHLAAENKLTVADADTLRQLGVPEGVRQVVRGRLAQRSATTSKMLGYAAICPGPFDFQLLQALAGLPEAVLLDSLDEALSAHLIRPTNAARETYDFVHAIVRRTLYDAWSPSRRVRLHRQLAEALIRLHTGHELDHAAELAVQFRESAGLPEAARGIVYALAAAERARASWAPEQAVNFLRIARDLATDVEAETRGRILCKLAVAEAEALLLYDAQHTIEQALATLSTANATPTAIAAFLADVLWALRTGGARPTQLRPLIERGLALLGATRDLTWARLVLLHDPIAPLPNSPIPAGRWLGFDRQAVALARERGNEEDFARTLDAFDPETRFATTEILERARTWTRPAAIIRAMGVVVRNLLYRHGAFRDAVSACEEFLATSERFGSIPGQADALAQLTRAHIALGDFALARTTEERARALVARLGPGHRLHTAPRWMETYLSYYLEGDWPPIAAYWTRIADAPAAGEEIIALLAAAIAAQAHARAGNEAEATRLVIALRSVLPSLEPTTWAFNGAVCLAAGAVWDLRLAEHADDYRRLALGLLDAGVGDFPLTSHFLTVARMAALVRDYAAASSAFAAARSSLETSGQRPLRAIVDYDEALALIRTDQADRVTAAQLVRHALTAFRALGMEGWIQRAQTLAAGLVRLDQPRLAGLTEREIEVVRLLSRGLSDRQIGDALSLSERTINAHVRNALSKTDLSNRTELAVWAVDHGLLVPEPQQ